MSSEAESLHRPDLIKDGDFTSEPSLMMVEENEKNFLSSINNLFISKEENEEEDFSINKNLRIIENCTRSKKLTTKNSLLKKFGISFKNKIREDCFDFQSENKHYLPNLGMGKCDSIRRLDYKTLKRLLNKEYTMDYLIIDCRYSFEYLGGHIKGAININCEESVKEFYFSNDSVTLILHCEFSSVRAPNIARMIRVLDRSVCEYPNLKFPEMYILEGGYKLFYSSCIEYCEPQKYIPMFSKDHVDELIREERAYKLKK